MIQWLAGEVLHLLSGGKLVEVMLTQCRDVRVGDARLTAQQEQLVGILCRLPDMLSNRLQQYLDPSLLPQPYFSQLGMDVFSCLQRVHNILRGRDNKGLPRPKHTNFYTPFSLLIVTSNYSHSTQSEHFLPWFVQVATTLVVASPG